MKADQTNIASLEPPAQRGLQRIQKSTCSGLAGSAHPQFRGTLAWGERTEAPSDWQYVAEICAERGEFAFSDIHAEYKRLQAVRNAA